MSVVAVTPDARDDFLRTWPMSSARRRTSTIADYGLISWRPYPQLYVGMATYTEQNRWATLEEFEVYEELRRKHRELLQRERSWWRDVSELQRFTPGTPQIEKVGL